MWKNASNVEDVRALLGVFAVDSLRAVAEAVLEQNGQRMLEIVQELERSGQSLQHYVRELARYWRNLLVARITGKRTPLIPASESEQQALLDTALRFSEEDLTRYLNLTLDLYRALQFSLQPRLHLELGLIKLVQAGRLQSIEDALAGLGAHRGSLSKESPADTAPLSATTRGHGATPLAVSVSRRTSRSQSARTDRPWCFAHREARQPAAHTIRSRFCPRLNGRPEDRSRSTLWPPLVSTSVPMQSANRR